MNFEFRSLTQEDFPIIYNCFVEAFSNNSQNIVISQDEFAQRLYRNNYLPQLSVGAFADNQLVGFILNCLTATTSYNAGTGVLPKYRGNRLTERMFNFSLPHLKQSGADSCFLEVLKNNTAALKAYERCGFGVKRELMLYALYSKNLRVSTPKIRFHIIETEFPDWPAYQRFSSFEPSYQNKPEAISRDWAEHTLIEAYHKAKLVGFCAFATRTGRISQIAVDENFRKKGIGSALLAKVYHLSRVKEITILNVDASAGEMLDFFKNTGFVRPIVQLEMSRLIE